MIDKAEINNKAAEFKIHAANVQRDYVFGWLLVGLYSVSDLRNVLILKGGNCFRKAYFQNTRFSKDLDFATETAIDPAYLRSEFDRICHFVQEQAGIVFEYDQNKVELQNEIDVEKRVFEVRLYFRDFYGRPDRFTISVSLDVTEFDRIYLPVQNRRLIHPYSDAATCAVTLQCLKLEEMLAAKLKCLLQRRHIQDLYDLAFSIFINQDLAVDRGEVASTFFRKTIFERSPRVAKELLLGLPFETLKGVWGRYIVAPVQGLFEFDAAVDSFKTFVDGLFGGAQPSFADFEYFPAHFRNPIMEAGERLVLLRLTYDHIPRLIEPYELAYKRRKDGRGQEYLYVYDRTGGRTTPAGIKTFVSSKIETIELTDESFEPRSKVMLSRAGEFGERVWFSKTPGIHRLRTTRHARLIRVPGWKYIIQCSYCNKHFTRKIRDTSLREHQDQYGNRCFGRRGIIVDQRYE